MFASGFLTIHRLNKTDDPKTWKVEASGFVLFLFNGLDEKTFPFPIVSHNKDVNYKKLNCMHNMLNWEYLIRRSVGNKFSILCG